MMHDSVFADHSITILGSSGNMIAGDNFRDLSGPSGGPLDTGTNLWSNGTVGNYWSYFAGTDQYGNGYGSVEYARNSVPPNGTEQHAAPTPYAIAGARVPVLEPIPVPIAGSEQTVPSLIKNQVIQIGSGTIPGGITIVNSTLYLAKDGTVAIGPNGGSITIENSTLIDQGYGFSLTCRGGYHCPTSMTIENSTLSGAFLNDINIQNLTIADSRILNAQGDRAISMQDAENVFVVNNTVSGGLNGVFTYCDPAISNKLSISGNTISNIIDTAMQVCVSETPSISVIGNGIESVLGSGIQLNGNAFVQGNTVTGCDGNAIFLGGTNNTIIDNSFIGSAVGIETGGSGNLIYRNNFIGDLVPVSGGGSNSWSHGGEGNYWSAYSGKDPDLDGIGDTPYQNGGVNDGYPFMQPYGWLSTFYLTIDTNLPPSTRFSINGSSFTLGSGGAIALRLGYAASYSITFPENVQLSNGSSLVFMKWGDGSNSSSMVVTLSSNSTLSATYALEAPATTTTTTTSASSVSSESSSVSTSTTASTSALSNSSVNSNGGGIPEFPFQLVGLAVLTVVLAASYLVMRRRLPN